MDSETLRIFSAVAAELSITRAAARLGRAPSNVTTRIQQLEGELGIELFSRVGKRMSLSAAGERLVEYSARLLALEEEARAEAKTAWSAAWQQAAGKEARGKKQGAKLHEASAEGEIFIIFYMIYI